MQTNVKEEMSSFDRLLADAQASRHAGSVVNNCQPLPFQLIVGAVVCGVLINSALYLTGVFIAGIARGNALAVHLALAATGACYISYALQFVFVCNSSPAVYRISVAATVASVLLGIAAGLSLIL